MGFSKAGMKTIWAVEIDLYCQKVLKKNFPDTKIYSDIKECGAHNLEEVDIISGGFPCQDISVAGKKAGITGSRSGLWSEMFRVISELRPRYTVIENVPNLINLGLETVLCDLASIGYDAEWQIISAKEVGAWHLRKRIWIIAYPQKMDGLWSIKKKENRQLGKCEEFRRLLWGATRPTLSRMVDGLPNGLDRLRALGNAIVPQIAEIISRKILGAEKR